MNKPTEPLLIATGLSQRFGDHLAVDNVSLSIRPGEIVGLLGLNGAGKSSTLRMLGGIQAPARGEILVRGKSLYRQPIDAKQRIGYLPEVAPLYTDMAVRDYLLFAARLHRLTGHAAHSAVERELQRLGLNTVAQRRIGHLSKGFRQRVGLAQALVHTPELLLLDEPSSGLDPEQMQQLRNLIRDVAVECAVLFSTHLLSEVTDLCNRVLVLHLGKIVHDSPLEQDTSVPSSYRISFRSPVTPDALRSVDGIGMITSLPNNSFRLDLAATEPDQLLNELVGRGFRVTEFVAERTSLETLFTGLVRAAVPAHP